MPGAVPGVPEHDPITHLAHAHDCDEARQDRDAHTHLEKTPLMSACDGLYISSVCR